MMMSGTGNIGQGPPNGYHKISGKKFFKSKIDFMAPIKSMQKREMLDPLTNHLSDDTITQYDAGYRHTGGY